MMENKPKKLSKEKVMEAIDTFFTENNLYGITGNYNGYYISITREKDECSICKQSRLQHHDYEVKK